MNRFLIAMVFSSLTVAAAGGTAAAQSSTLPVQGFLTDSDDVPRDGNVAITFKLYDDDTEVFSETQTLAVRRGAFTVYLGSVEMLDPTLFRDMNGLTLGITVVGEAEMAPRLALGGVPYAGFAAFADDAETLAGMAATAFASAGHSHAFDELSSVPAGLADGDDDTTYTAGDGLILGGTTFSLDGVAVQMAIESALGAISDENPLNHDRYTDAEAVSALEATVANLQAQIDSLGATATFSTRGTASLDFGAIAASECLSFVVPVTGAQVGEECATGANPAPEPSIHITCTVESAGVVRGSICNVSGPPVNPALTVYSARVFRN